MDTIKKDFPGIHIVDFEFGLDTVETALQATEDLLTRNTEVTGFLRVTNDRYGHEGIAKFGKGPQNKNGRALTRAYC